MNHDVHTFFASRVRVRTSSAALARRVCGTRDRGIALASSVLCCVLPVFEGRTSDSDFRLGVVTLASRRTVPSIVQSAILRRVSSRFIDSEHNKESRTTRYSAAPSLKSQESRVKTAKFCAQRTHPPSPRLVSISERSFRGWYCSPLPVGTADGGIESSTVDGSVTLFAGSAMASHGVRQC